MNNEVSKQVLKETEIGVIPVEWKLSKLEEITKRTEKKNPRKIPEWRFKYIDVSSVSNETYRIESVRELSSNQAPNRARKLIRENDILFATVRPSLHRIALVPKSLDGQICSTAFCVIRCNPTMVLPQYLFYAVISRRFLQQVARRQRGASYPAVTDGDILTQVIPLPSLKEQQQIVNVLFAVQNAIYRSIDVIQETKLFKKSLMKHLFAYGAVSQIKASDIALKESEIGFIPGNWIIRPFTECIMKKQISMKTVKQSLYQKEGRFPIIDQSKNDVAGYWDREEDVWQSPLPVIIFGDHTREIKFVDFPFVCGAQGTKVLLPDRASNEPLFFYYALQNLKIASRGYNRHYSLLKENKIPFPPIKEQRKIGNILSAIDKKINAELNKKQALTFLLETLLHNLLNGEIRMN